MGRTDPFFERFRHKLNWKFRESLRLGRIKVQSMRGNSWKWKRKGLREAGFSIAAMVVVDEGWVDAEDLIQSLALKRQRFGLTLVLGSNAWWTLGVNRRCFLC